MTRSSAPSSRGRPRLRLPDAPTGRPLPCRRDCNRPGGRPDRDRRELRRNSRRSGTPREHSLRRGSRTLRRWDAQLVGGGEGPAFGLGCRICVLAGRMGGALGRLCMSNQTNRDVSSQTDREGGRGGRRSHPTTPLLRCRFTDSPVRGQSAREQWLHDITESNRSVPLGRLIRPLRVCGRADPGGLRRAGSAP
jgi:hypothetical protein